MNETIQDVEYWKTQVQSWFEKNVHTDKENPEIIGIAGQVLVEFGNDWNKSNIKAVYDGLADHNIPTKPPYYEQKRIRIDASDKRLITDI